MSEFIEKLIGRLEEYKDSHLIEHDSEECLHCQENEDDWCNCRDCSICVWDKAVEIVNQLAEEYKPKSEWQSIYDKVVSLEYEYAENGNEDAVNDCIRLENLLQYFKEELQSAEECKEQNIDQDMMVVASLPSLYPMMKPFEVEALDRVVRGAKHSGGWIPVSERLPEIDGNTSDVVLVCTVDGFQHMAFWCDDKKWRYCESGMIKNTMEWTEIIAWQPLPAPYQPKGE